MSKRRFMAGILTAVMCFSAIPSVQPPVVHAKENDMPGISSFHYEQLDGTAKGIYDGLYQMYESGLLKTGNADYDLTANGQFTRDECRALSGDSKKLRSAMDAARYAFYADYPEIFYVNFPKLNVRITTDNSGAYHMYLGSGRYENFYTDGFADVSQVDSAITEFESRVDEIAEGARNIEVPEGKNRQVEQIRYVHNEIIDNVSYRMEDTCFEGDGENKSNAPLLGTPYGTLVKKQGVCEGYARAFKSVLDELGIRSILVQGVHQYDGEVAVSHMWNYVELTESDNTRALGSKWYACDLTMDDPEIVVNPDKELLDYTQHFDIYGNDGFEHEKYFLAGQLTLNGRHFIDDTVAAAGDYAFAYPLIEDVDYGVRDAVNTQDGFSVKQKTITGSHGLDVTEFQISYRGMNMTTARQEGIYLLARYYDEDEDGMVVPLTGWCYFSDGYELQEDENSVYLQEGEVMYMEFAATNVVPRPGLEGYTYAGDDKGLIARTGKIYNENRNDYDAPPFILRATPSQTATIFPGNRLYHIMLEYDERLELVEGLSEDDLSMNIQCHSVNGSATSAAEYSKVSNITWDGNSIVEFDVQFSQMFADDSVNYNFYIEGLIGAESKKIPNPACYGVAARVECPCVQDRRGSWELYGKPTLLEDRDLSMQDWTMSNGKAVSDKLLNRIALVTTKTTGAQEEQMQDVLDRDIPGASDEILESSTYNITLNVCKLSAVKTGHKLKVKVGFPEGYGPEDEGVTFKAYHFKRDAQGNVTGVEEIGCVVTPYGLVITCDSFSPFTVAAVARDENEASDRTVIVTSSDGGTITGADSGMFTLTEGSSRTLHIQPEEGFEIESVAVCGSSVEVADPDGMDIQADYDMAGTDNIVHAEFVAKAVTEKEKQRGEEAVAPVAEPVEVKIPETLAASGSIDIVPEISEKPGVLSCQWYKDDVALENGTDRELHVTDIDESAAGSYRLEITNTLGIASAKSVSNVCTVSVSDKSCTHAHTTAHPAVASTCTTAGHEEYVTCDDCGIIISGSDEKLPLGDHIMENTVDEEFLKTGATCKDKAVYYKSCSVCGEKSTDTFEYGDLAEHTLSGTDAKEATHEEDGHIAYFTCSVCEKLFTDAEGLKETDMDSIMIPRQEHEFVYRYDEEGHWGECACGASREKTGHEFGDWIITKPATDTEDGERERKCVCGKTETDTIPMGEHILSETYESDEDGHWKTCSCGNITDKEAHVYGEWITVTEATHTEAGLEKQTCDICAYEITREIPATGHEYSFKSDTDGHYKECACGDKTEKESHMFTKWSVTKEAAENEPGLEERSCLVCGYKETREIPALPHEHVPGEQYRSDRDGHWKECACGEAMDKESHRFDSWSVVKEATHTETGSRERSCSVCGYKDMEEIPVIPEKPSKPDTHKHAAEDGYRSDAGSHWKTCSCGEVMEKKLHVYGKWVTVREASEGEQGLRERTCNICGYRETQMMDAPAHKHTPGSEYQSDSENHWKTCACGEVMDKAGHTFGKWVKKTSGSEERICSVCGYKETRTATATEKPDKDNSKPSDETSAKPDRGDSKPSDTATEKPDKDNSQRTSGTSSTKPVADRAGQETGIAAARAETIKTGDMGMIPLFAMSGILVMAGAGLLIYRRVKRRK